MIPRLFTIPLRYSTTGNNTLYHNKRYTFSLLNHRLFTVYQNHIRQYQDSSEKPQSTLKNNQVRSPLNSKLLQLKPIKPNALFISCTVFNSKGSIVKVSQNFNKWNFLRDHNLFPRDLRKIDTSSVDIIPTILVKPHCILVNLLHIKALIEKDRVFIFDTTIPESAMKLGVLMYDMESRLSQVNPNSNNFYEHRALEIILINIMSCLEVEFKECSTVCKQILIDLENEVNREKLRELLIKSKALSSFYQKTFLIRQVLDDLLENDDDMAMMYLTDPRIPHTDTASNSIPPSLSSSSSLKMTYNGKEVNGDASSENIKDANEEDEDGEKDIDFSDLEMLIENYYTQCDEFVQQSISLIEDIKSTEEIVNIILDANRNSLMLLELKITIYTLGFTVASLLPAFYGMNLKNFIEESSFGFPGVMLISFLMGLFVVRANFRALKSVTKLSMFKTSSELESGFVQKTNSNKNISSFSFNKKYSDKLSSSHSFSASLSPQLYSSSTISSSSVGKHSYRSLLKATWWSNFKEVLIRYWFGEKYTPKNITNLMSSHINTRTNCSDEEKDVVWKWLIDNKKN